MNLALIINPVAGGWSPTDPESWGGGEETVVHWARGMAQRHAVTVYWDGPEFRDETHDGYMPTIYRPYDAMVGAEPVDVAIYRKVPEWAGRCPATRSWCWTDQVRPQDLSPFERVVVASPFLQRCLAAASPIAATRLTVIPDGFVPYLKTAVDRDPNLVLFASSPDRGLIPLLTAWPTVRAARPDARLLITYGWDIFRRCGGSPALAERAQSLIQAQAESVTMRRVPFAEMPAIYQTAGVWAYYCLGGEYFCQVAAKAQMAGCVPVVRPWGALHDTVWSGLTCPDEATFTAELIRALDHDEQARLRTAQQDIIAAGTQAHAVPWVAVCQQWTDLLATPLAADEPERSHLVVTPGVPAGLVPSADVTHGDAMIRQRLTQWHQQYTVDGTPPTPVTLGWALEEAPAGSMTDLLESHGVMPGEWVLALTSLGPWRAGPRQRQVGRRDIQEWFGGQPELQSDVITLDQDGNAFCLTWFKYDPAAVGVRSLDRVLAHQVPRDTCSVCFITPPVIADASLLKTLRSVEPLADEVVIAVNGADPEGDPIPWTRLGTIAEDWATATGIDTRIIPALSPRYCFDCQADHDVGAYQPGHRVAGFETPRNQSIATARGDWICWLDADEELLYPERLSKFLRPNMFVGYAINQDHNSSDPPEARKRDTPVRLFRRRVDPDHPEPGVIRIGDHDWPTYHTGLTARFAGIVHEHPGLGPGYIDGMGPVLLVPDVFIAHSGYHTEAMRRGRFLRNWPLMVADRQKYPLRRLGTFLWLRDLSHHLRYLIEQAKGVLTPELTSYARECLRLYREHFVKAVDPYTQEARQYATVAMQALGQGFEVSGQIQIRRPEAGEDVLTVPITGRVEDGDQLVKIVQAQLGGLERWQGPWA